SPRVVGAALAAARRRGRAGGDKPLPYSRRNTRPKTTTPRHRRGVSRSGSRGELQRLTLQGQLDDGLFLVRGEQLHDAVDGALLDLVGGLDDDRVGDAFLRWDDVGQEAGDRDLGLGDLDRDGRLVVGDDDVAGDGILAGGEVAEVDEDRRDLDAGAHDAGDRDLDLRLLRDARRDADRGGEQALGRVTGDRQRQVVLIAGVAGDLVLLAGRRELGLDVRLRGLGDRRLEGLLVGEEDHVLRVAVALDDREPDVRVRQHVDERLDDRLDEEVDLRTVGVVRDQEDRLRDRAREGLPVHVGD